MGIYWDCLRTVLGWDWDWAYRRQKAGTGTKIGADQEKILKKFWKKMMGKRWGILDGLGWVKKREFWGWFGEIKWQFPEGPDFEIKKRQSEAILSWFEAILGQISSILGGSEG